MDPAALARAYYDTLDEEDYARLRELLAPGFTQERGDRSLDDRTSFISFMRDERPESDTTHEIDRVTANGDRVVVEGTVYHADGEPWFDFADVFAVQDGQLTSLQTYTR